MYGDIRHIYVMQSEIENEIDFGEIHNSADKYSKAFNTHHHQRQAKNVKPTKSEGRKNYRNGDASEPHFRPVNNRLRTKPPKVTDKSPLADNQINLNANVDDTKLKITSENGQETSEKTTEATSTTSSIKITTENDEEISTEESDQTIVEAVDKAALDLFSNISSAFTASSTTTTTLETSTTKTMSKTLSESTHEFSVTERNTQLKNDEEKPIEVSETSTSTSTSKEPLATTTTQAQLFQDSMSVPPVVTNKRGV